MIKIENLNKFYESKRASMHHALKDVNLVLPDKGLVFVLGKSGSGKSTFLNMIGGLDRPSAGRLIVDGKDLFKLNDQQLVDYKRRTVGFVWQNNARNLMPYLTAWQNVQMPMLFEKNVKKKKQRALELLELVGLAHKKHSKLTQMSGGEQQRVAVAIALANNPKLLLADEPTGSVDAKTGAYILDVLRTINRDLGLTTVIVTHDPLLAKKVNRVVAIRDGKIASERIMKQSYLTRLEDIDAFTHTEDVQDEYAVLDRANRLQVPKEMLEKIGHSGNRLKVSMQDGKIILEAPDEN
jgi:ABC-type lipoprotein export system ATPase subunit